MSLVEHLEELRKRIIICLITIFFATFISYFLNDEILRYLSKPIGNLYFLKIVDAFLIRLKVSILIGIFLSSPIIFLQIWLFIAPALKENEKKYAVPFVLFSFLFFLIGGVFGVIILPLSVKVLLSFQGENLKPIITSDAYINFVLFLIISFAVVFELPTIIMLLTKLKIVSSVFLKTKRKYAILLIFIFAAILSPGTDVFSQILMAIPLVLLYELSIFLSKIIEKGG